MRPLYALAIVAIPSLAFAQEMPTEDLGQLLAFVLAQAQAGNWTGAAVVMLFALVLVLRSFGSRVWPWLATDVGGSVLGYVMAPLGILAGAALAGLPITWTFAQGVLVAAFLSGAAWTAIRRVLLRLALPYAYELAKRIPIVGTLLIPLIERFVGKALDAGRAAALRVLQREPVATSRLGLDEARPAPAVVPDPPAELVENTTPGRGPSDG